MSADGSTVVGYGVDLNSSFEALRWTNNVMTNLGDLPGGNIYSGAYATSADGSVIVGFGTSDSGSAASRWDSTHGMQPLSALLIAASANLTDWTLQAATGISTDGKTIVGYGKHNGNTEAWIASLVSISDTPLPILIPSISILRKKKISTIKSKLVIKGVTTGVVTKVACQIGKGILKPAPRHGQLEIHGQAQARQKQNHHHVHRPRWNLHARKGHDHP